MPLIKDGEVIFDEWTVVGPEDPLPDHVPIIVRTARWNEHREVLLRSDRRLGILLESHEAPNLVAGDLSRFEVVAIDFPTFRDGRPFSSARELRERYRYTGEVRAVGDVGRDQLHFMQRCGFDAFDVPESISAKDWRDAVSSFSVWYQPGTDQRMSVWQLRRHVVAAE